MIIEGAGRTAELTVERAELRLSASQQGYEAELRRSHAHETAAVAHKEFPNLGIHVPDFDEFARSLESPYSQVIDRLVQHLHNPGRRTTTLAIIRMLGNWGADDDIQKLILEDQRGFPTKPGCNYRLINRGSPEARREITVNPSVVDPFNLVEITRKRCFLTTSMTEEVICSPAGQRFQLFSTTEIDKRSSFILDIGQLEKQSAAAAREVRSVILWDMYLRYATSDYWSTVDAAANPGQYTGMHAGMQELMEKSDRYGIGYAEILTRAHREKSYQQLQRIESIAYIEEAIAEGARNSLLTPSATTYFAERSLIAHAQIPRAFRVPAGVIVANYN